ncbi:MAG: tetratricopeptide repeat protein [Pyrinomonadaceae bacterium]
MNKFILLILFAFSFLCISAQIDKDTLNQSKALQEADKIGVEIVRLFRARKFDEALPLALKVVELRENTVGENHVSVAQAWRNLAYIQLQLNQRKEARKAFENAFGIYEKNKILSAEDEKMFTEMLEAVAIYEANDGDLPRAEKKLFRALELNEKLFGKEALETANTMFKLGQLYKVKEDYKKAAPLLLSVLDIRAAKLGNKNDQTQEVYDITNCVLSKLGRESEIIRLQERFYPKSSENLKQQNETPSIINGGVINGKAIYLATPPYPLAAKANRITGTVSVRVTINENGTVAFACAIKGAMELQQASENAAYQSRFSPTLLDGKPVKVSGVIIYNFTR